MVSAIFGVIGDSVSAFATCFGSALASITSMFYAEATGLTTLGTLSVVAIGVGLVYGAFKLIKGLISRA